MSGPKLPPRWLRCPRKGQLIACKFLPFKTPLDDRYDLQIPEGDRFDVKMLIEFMEARQLKMGLVVDLTKTSRFYDKAQLLQHGLRYIKLQCAGHDETPTKDQVASFNSICQSFFSHNPGQIIGIHCTHGFNRTGFLIIAYLLQVEDWSFEDAMTAFIRARPPGIYKSEYLDELAHRYNNGDRGGFKTTPRPEWCDEEDGDEEEAARRPREKNNENATFMEGVNGVFLVPSPTRDQVQMDCQAILGWTQSGFPGSQPVSMDVQNIKLLSQKPYRVTWKADGTRYLMYIKGPGEVYMIDRDNSVFQVPRISFPARKRAGDGVRSTLLDGEMVLDKVEGVMRPRYLIYDVMQFEANSGVATWDHKKRLQCAEHELTQPRESTAMAGGLDKNSESFGVRVKGFWDINKTKWILEEFSPTLAHGTDGLIFSPAYDYYEPGQCPSLLKWKPPEINTVDFLLKIVIENRPGLLPEKVGQLYVGSLITPFAQIDVKGNRELLKHNERIIECAWDQKSGWKFERVREDKSFPNSFTTATSVCNTIRQPVTKEWLYEVIEKYGWKPTVVAPPPHHGEKRSHEVATDGANDDSLMPPPKKVPRPS